MLSPPYQSLITLSLVKTAPVKGETGGVALLESAEASPVRGHLHPPRKKLFRALSGLRLAESLLFIPLGRPDIRENDRLYLGGRGYRALTVRVFPLHTEIELEAI